MDIENIDLYALLEVSSHSSVQEIKSAYRKKALKCHPDKNPDNPEAVKLFLQLSKALEILCDDTAREAYNKVLNGKKLAKLRHQELDARRKKFKEDLEARERKAEQEKVNRSFDSRTDEEKLKAEIERLRKEGSKQVAEEQELVRQQILKERNGCPTEFSTAPCTKLKISWTNADNTDMSYDEDNLHKIFSKFGEIEALIISKKKKKKNIGSALVEFKTQQAAEDALRLEKGLVTCPLTLEWVEKPNYLSSKGSERTSHSFFPQVSEQNTTIPVSCMFPAFSTTSHSTENATHSNIADDFEKQVLRRLKLAQQIKKSQEETQNKE